jgi:predicted nucleic acid-binding protein
MILLRKDHLNYLTAHAKVHIRDISDEKILQAAIESHCDIFITGDKDFFNQKYNQLEILTPKDFLDKFSFCL